MVPGNCLIPCCFAFWVSGGFCFFCFCFFCQDVNFCCAHHVPCHVTSRCTPRWISGAWRWQAAQEREKKNFDYKPRGTAVTSQAAEPRFHQACMRTFRKPYAPVWPSVRAVTPSCPNICQAHSLALTLWPTWKTERLEVSHQRQMSVRIQWQRVLTWVLLFTSLQPV